MIKIATIVGLITCISLNISAAETKLPNTPFERFVGEWRESGKLDGGKGKATKHEKWSGKFSIDHTKFLITYEDGRQWVFTVSEADNGFVAKLDSGDEGKLLGKWLEKEEILEWTGTNSDGHEKVVRILLRENAEIRTTVVVKGHDGQKVFDWIGISLKTEKPASEDKSVEAEASAGKPASRPEPKSSDDLNPNPDSEARPQ